MDVIEKIIRRMFDFPLNLNHGNDVSESFSDVVAAVSGCINVFEKKFFMMPSNHCTEIFNLLVNHIKKQYQKIIYNEEISKVRQLIIEFFLRLRANHNNQIGLYSNGITEFGVYILCLNSKDSADSIPSSPPPGSPSAVSQAFSYLNFDKAYQVMITCLKEEKDWRVLEVLLRGLPKTLQNKALFLHGNCNISSLCLTLYSMINDGSYGFPGSLKNAPDRLTKTDISSQIFPCVASLASYNTLMESHVQRILIRCLQSGLVSRSAKVCMEGLTLCTLEMQNCMMKVLPEVLLKLSQISTTVGVSVSVLEFLSNLIRLPHLYVSFVEDQYMSIFAIALPYTNPFKFNQYTVALAHHVLSMWFLKCRIPFRRDFAKFITKGLHNNLNIPREYYLTPKSSDASRNDDSSSGEVSNDAIIALHTELMETGLDLMARFTFGMTSNVPKRSPVAEFLLENGQNSSWLIGNKIVTITTSGCGTKSFKDGLCEQCYSSCHEVIPGENANKSNQIVLEHNMADLSSEPFAEKRKRHRSAIQRSNTRIGSESIGPEIKTKDDIQLHFQKFKGLFHVQQQHSSTTKADVTSGKADWSSESKAKDNGSNLCSCWCTSWAEIHIRRPTGNTSWMMKIQNQLFLPSAPLDLPLSSLTSLVLPEACKSEELDISFAESESESSIYVETEIKEPTCEGAIDIVASHQKTSPPVRRTNSSPDMNTGWTNFESLDKETSNKCDLEEDTSASVNDIGFNVQNFPTYEEKTKSPTKRHLKLDLSAKVLSEKIPSASALKDDKSGISSAPIDKFFQKENSTPLPSAGLGQFRGRGYTMPVLSPPEANTSVKQPEASRRSGMSPSFVFLQLFHNSCFGPATHKPLLLLKNKQNETTLNVLDHIPPYDTHKIGVVYVGPDQSEDEVAILSNVYGSARYIAFLRGLGKLVLLNDLDPQTTYLGGLDTRGEDGKFTIIWHDDVMQVAFHVATLMLNKESDRMRNEKKKHIGNDSVVIVYNESGKDYNISTIKGQVINAWVIIKPDDFNNNIVSVKLRSKELADTFGHTEEYIVSDVCLSVFVRQMALHANLAALIITRRQQQHGKYAQISNWLERLRTIKRLRSKILEEIKSRNDGAGSDTSDTVDFDDFTDYV